MVMRFLQSSWPKTFEGPLSELDPPEDQDEPEGGDTIEEPTLKELETLQTDKDKWDDIMKSCKSKCKTVTLTFVEILPDKQGLNSCECIVQGV